MLKLENKAALKNERLHILKEILLQPITSYKIDSSKMLQHANFSKSSYTTTKDYILNSRWLYTKDNRFIIQVFLNSCLRSTDRCYLRKCGNKNIRTTENLKGKFCWQEKLDVWKRLSFSKQLQIIFLADSKKQNRYCR